MAFVVRLIKVCGALVLAISGGGLKVLDGWLVTVIFAIFAGLGEIEREEVAPTSGFVAALGFLVEVLVGEELPEVVVLAFSLPPVDFSSSDRRPSEVKAAAAACCW